MNCPSCDRELPEDATFCGYCGSALRPEQTCARCGRSNPAEMRFCLECGRAFAESAPPDRDPRSYTSKHLADKILQSQFVLEGERKQVTVLFADVKGSMELAEKLDPEQWRGILERFFQILTDGVHRFEGTVNQYTGEALEAARWHRRAAEWLLKSGVAESVTHWKRVYELAKSEPSTPETTGLLLGACGMLVANSFRVGLAEDERDRFAAEGRELAERMGDRAGLFMLELGLTVARNLAGGSSESPLVPAQRTIEIAEDLDLEMQFGARLVLGNVLWQSGRVTDALLATEEALELAGADLELGVIFQGFSLSNFALFQKACLLMWKGQPREAAGCFERSLEVASERNEHTPVCQVSCWSGSAFEELTGISQQALARSQRAVERAGDPFDRTCARLYLGWAQLLHGKAAEALESLMRLDYLQRERGIAGVLLNLGQGLLGEAHLSAGDAASARTVANRCTADRDTWVYELRAHLSRSRVLRALDGADAQDEIEARLARAQDLLEKSGARAFAPFIVEEQARLAAVLGDGEVASNPLRQARGLFGEVEATGHVERIARELGA